eukprot:scaffold207_cov409-Prasinococcus_capsulatus_cf.AAC.88
MGDYVSSQDFESGADNGMETKVRGVPGLSSPRGCCGRHRTHSSWKSLIVYSRCKLAVRSNPSAYFASRTTTLPPSCPPATRSAHPNAAVTQRRCAPTYRKQCWLPLSTARTYINLAIVCTWTAQGARHSPSCETMRNKTVRTLPHINALIVMPGLIGLTEFRSDHNSLPGGLR